MVKSLWTMDYGLWFLSFVFVLLSLFYCLCSVVCCLLSAVFRLLYLNIVTSDQEIVEYAFQPFAYKEMHYQSNKCVSTC